jgi:uncharacterized RDD family membrane protein YckC
MADLPPPPPGSAFPPPPPPGASGYGVPTSPGIGARASFGARLGAFIIDGLLGALLSVPGWIALVTGPKRITTCDVDSEGTITGFGDGSSVCEVPTGGTIALAVLLFLIGGVGFWIWNYVIRQGRTGQTIGKSAVNIRVVDATTGQPIGPGRALGRSLFAAFISGNVCLLGYLWMLWDENKQTWHDKIVSCVVVPG